MPNPKPEDAATFESAMIRLKKLVYKQRVRVKDFLVDFDKLRSGFVHPNHFLGARKGHVQGPNRGPRRPAQGHCADCFMPIA